MGFRGRRAAFGGGVVRGLLPELRLVMPVDFGGCPILECRQRRIDAGYENF